MVIMTAMMTVKAQNFSDIVGQLKSVTGVEAKEINQSFQGIPTEGGWALIAPTEAKGDIMKIVNSIDGKYLFNSSDKDGSKVFIKQESDPVEIFSIVELVLPIIDDKNIMMIYLETSPDVLPMVKDFFSR